jgi:hypothetical protein
MLINKLFIGQETKAIINFSMAFALLGIFLVWILWLRRIYYRKLDAIATVEEMGQNTQTNFVMARILKTIEYVAPFGFIALFMKGLTYIQIKPHAVFVQILYYFGAGFLILVLHDYLKNQWINEMIIRKANQLDDAKNKMRQRQEIKISRR